MVLMLRPGQAVRVNLAGMQVGSVVFHAAAPTPWARLSAKSPKILRSIRWGCFSRSAGWAKWKCQRVGSSPS